MKAKSKISGMLHSSFKPDKCKTSLKLAVARIKLLKNKREVLVKQMRRDLAQLLEANQDQTARIRVEHVIREEKTMAAYDLIDVYCELIVARMPIIESQKNCPIDLKEAISSVVFASPRCADIPELMDVRKHFVAKYGKEFVTAALEVRPDSGVSRLMVEKLSAKAPDIDTKVKVLTEIAKERNINWDPKAFEEQLQKPKDDLLDGSDKFNGVKKMTMEASIPKPPSSESWNNEPSTSAPGKFMTNKETLPDFNVQSPTNLPHSKASEEVRYSYPEDKNASFSRSDWNMEFKDAASAAKAAAESAEMASIAARAAAELASQGNVSVQSSADQYESSIYGTKDKQSKSLKSSKLESTNVVEAAKYAEDYRRKNSHHMDQNMHKIHSDDAGQSSRKVDKNTTAIHVTSGNLKPKNSDSDDIVAGNVEYVGFRQDKNSRRPGKNPSEIYVKTGNLTPESGSKDNLESEDFLYEDDDRAYNVVHPSFSDVEPSIKNFDYYENQVTDSSNQIYEKSESSHHGATNDNYTIWDENESSNKVEDSIDVNFDRYESDSEDHSNFETYRRDSFFNPITSKQREEYTNFPFNMNTSNDEQHISGTSLDQSKSRFVSAAETNHKDRADIITEVNSKLDHNMPPSFDSDSSKSDTDDEINTPTQKGVTKPSSYLLGDSKSNTGLSPAMSGNGSEFMNDEEEDNPSSFPDIDYRSSEEESGSTMKNWSKSGLSLLGKQQTPRAKSPKSHYDSWERQAEDEPSYSSVDGNTSSTLDFGRLKGGLRNRGYGSPKVENFFIGSSLGAKQEADETSSLERKLVASDFSAVSEVPTIEKYNKVSGASYTSSKSTRVPVDLSVDNAEKRKATEEKSDSVRNSFISQFDEEVLGNYVQESYKPPLGKEQKQSDFRSSLTKVGAKDIKEHKYAAETEDHLEDNSPVKGRADRDDSPTFEKLKFSRPNKLTSAPETQGDFSDQKGQVGSRMQSIYSDSDYEAEEAENVTKRANKEFKLSRRTRGGPAVSKLDVGSGITNQSLKFSQPSSESEPLTKVSNYPGHVDKAIRKSAESYSYTEEPPAEQVGNLLSPVKGTKRSEAEDVQASLPEKEENENTGTAIARQTSRENSLKNSSHTHPKLPDYETLADYFHSLRSNVRQK